jgi:uncharacterized protein (TIGR03086 family)
LDIFEAFDVAHDEFERVLRRVGEDQWTLPTPCTEWNVYEVANHVVGAGQYFMALLNGAAKEEALKVLLTADLLMPDPVTAFVTQRPMLRASFSAPGALDLVGHHVIADMTGDQLLRGCVSETTVHTWDIARATGANENLDPQLVDDVLEIFEVLAPLFVANGFAAASVGVSPGASAQQRLLALSGRQPCAAG